MNWLMAAVYIRGGSAACRRPREPDSHHTGRILGYKGGGGMERPRNTLITLHLPFGLGQFMTWSTSRPLAWVFWRMRMGQFKKQGPGSFQGENSGLQDWS